MQMSCQMQGIMQICGGRQRSVNPWCCGSLRSELRRSSSAL